MKPLVERIIKEALSIEMIMCGILMILVPVVVYVAAPVYIQMQKLPLEGIHNMRMLGFEFAAFMLLKLLTNWRAKKLNLKWLITAIVLCIPPLINISMLWSTVEFSIGSFIGMSIYTIIVFGPSICIFFCGFYYFYLLWRERRKERVSFPN